MADYRNLEVWRRAHALTLVIYALTATLPASERYGLISQMRRSAASIPMNLAEGSGRATDRDYARFVSHAIGSASELEYQLILIQDLGYGQRTDPAHARTLTVEVRRMLVALRRALVNT